MMSISSVLRLGSSRCMSMGQTSSARENSTNAGASRAWRSARARSPLRRYIDRRQDHREGPLAHEPRRTGGRRIDRNWSGSASGNNPASVFGALKIVFLGDEFEKECEGQGPRLALRTVGIDPAQRRIEHAAHRLKDLPPRRDLEWIDLHQLARRSDRQTPATGSSRGPGQASTPSARNAASLSGSLAAGRRRNERFDERLQRLVPQQPVANDEQLLGSRLGLAQVVDEALCLRRIVGQQVPARPRSGRRMSPRSLTSDCSRVPDKRPVCTELFDDLRHRAGPRPSRGSPLGHWLQSAGGPSSC